MPGTQQAPVVYTTVAQGAIAKGRAVGWNAQQANDGVSSAGVSIMGVADHPASSGDAVRVILAISALAEAGAVIDGTETRLKTDSQGRFIPWTASSIVAARLMPGATNVATAAGQFVEVSPIRT